MLSTRGHSYLTVTLNRFFNQLSAKQKKSIEVVVIDMWDPYIKAVKTTAGGHRL